MGPMMSSKGPLMRTPAEGPQVFREHQEALAELEKEKMSLLRAGQQLTKSFNPTHADWLNHEVV